MTGAGFNLSSALRGGSVVGAANVASSIFAAANALLLASLLGPEGLGKYAFIMAGVVLASSVAALGQGPLVIAQLAKQADKSTRADPVRSALTLTAISSIGLAGLVVLVVLLAPWGSTELANSGELVASSILVVAITLSGIVAESFRGLNRLTHASLFGEASQRALLAVLLSAAHFAGKDFTPLSALSLTAIAWLVISLAGLASLRAIPRNRCESSVSVKGLKSLAMSGLPIAAQSLLGVVFIRIPIWALGVFGLLAGAGVYSLALSFANMAGLIKKTMNGTLAPYIASAYETGAKGTLEHHLRTVGAAATLAMGAMGGLLLVGASIVVPIVFDPGFGQVIPVLSILLLGKLVAVLAGSSGYLLNLTGNQRWALTAGLVAVAIAIPSVILGTLLYGVIGAAAGSTAALASNQFLQVRFARTRAGVRTEADFRALMMYWRRRRRAVSR